MQKGASRHLPELVLEFPTSNTKDKYSGHTGATCTRFTFREFGSQRALLRVHAKLERAKHINLFVEAIGLSSTQT